MQPPEPWSWPRTMLTFAGTLVAVLLLGRIPLAGTGGELSRVLLQASPLLLLIRGAVSASGALNPGTNKATRAVGAAVFLGAAHVQGALQGRTAVGQLTTLGALGIVWGLADLLSRSRRLHGAVSLYAVLAWIGIVQGFVALGTELATGERGWIDGMAGVALLGPLVLALVGGLALPNGRWPLPLGAGIDARSALDLVLMALSGALLAGQGVGAALALAGVSNPFVRPAVALVVVVAALSSYASRRTPGPRERRLVPPLVVLPSLALGALAVGWLRAGGFEPGPFDGATSADVVLSCPNPHAPGDQGVIARRLRSLRVDGAVTVLDPRHVRLTLNQVVDPQAVLSAVLAPGRLSIQRVSPTLAGPEAAAGAATCASGAPCEFLALEPSVMGNADLAEAIPGTDAYGEPVLRLAFTPAGRAAFARLTAESVGSRVAIRLDDRVLVAPLVREAITEGVAMVSFGGRPKEEAAAEAAALAAALNGGALAGVWTPDSVLVR